jgi:hypothetical protein
MGAGFDKDRERRGSHVKSDLQRIIAGTSRPARHVTCSAPWAQQSALHCTACEEGRTTCERTAGPAGGDQAATRGPRCRSGLKGDPAQKLTKKKALVIAQFSRGGAFREVCSRGRMNVQGLPAIGGRDDL